jgi:tetratricopeptide (TPR) repeat protein
MGAVFMAEQTQPVQRKVAIKVIKPGMDSHHVLARFEQERQAMAMMDHPHIAKVLDAGMTESGRPYFVMELVKGVPITQYCDREHLTPKERLELFIPICQAVQHAHQKGIIHRDLKPSNVLIALYDGKPVPKVIDFGVAKATGQKLTDKTMFTEVGQVVGTLEYMAPEQAELNNLDIDTRADIYSLGALLYELMTGSPPFTKVQLRGTAYTDMLRIIREVEPPRPSTKLSSSQELPTLAAQRKLEPKRLTRLLQGELDWIVMKCLEKERSRRYETANSLAMDIQRFLANEPVVAGPPGGAYRVRKFVRRNRAAVVTATAFVALLLLGIVASVWQAVRATNAEAAARANEAMAVANEQKALAAVTAEAKAKQEAQAAAAAEAEQRSAADAEKRIAQAVRDFLQNYLLMQASAGEQADRLRTLGGAGFEVKYNPTVKELLERAAAGLTPERIEQKFPKAPLVQAEILFTVGHAYGAVGEYATAIAHLQRAADLRRTHLGQDHPDTLRVLDQLAYSCLFAGKTDEAVALYEKVRDCRISKVGRDAPDTVSTLIGLAEAYTHAGRTPEAIVLLQDIRDRAMAKLGPDHADTLKSLHELAMAYVRQGRTTESIALLEKERDARIAKSGPDHPCTLLALGCLGQAYDLAGRGADAVALLEKVRVTCAAKVGPDHLYTLFTVRVLAEAYLSLERAEEAIGLLEKVRTTFVENYGTGNPQTLHCLRGLARAYQRSGKTGDAIALFEKDRDLSIPMIGPDHPDTIYTIHDLADAYASAGRTREAIALYEKVRDACSVKLGADHPATLSTMQGLANHYRRAGRTREAIALYEKVRDGRISKLGPDHPHTLTTLHALGVAHWSVRNVKQSVPLF